MDRKQIVQQASLLKDKADLLNLLNLIKKAEIEDMGFDSSMYRPFTEKQLNFYCNPNHTFHRYRQFKIKKKSGKESRQITAPRTQTFMMMLSAVNQLFRSMYTPSEDAMGFKGFLPQYPSSKSLETASGSTIQVQSAYCQFVGWIVLHERES